MKNKGDKVVYFPGLNGLRFIAATLVVIQHIEQEKSYAGLPNIFSNPVIHSIGGLGVTLFFVLSGFLISFLLFKENEEAGTIVVKNFYIRRILRIWPLYYLVVVLGFFVLPHFVRLADQPPHHYSHSGPELLLFLLIMPNVSRVLFSVHAVINHLWSVGVEEQFYLIWPVVIKHVKKRRLLFLFCVVAGMWFLRKVLFSLNGPENKYHLGQNARELAAYAVTFFYFFRIDCMAIGGIGAYILHKNYRRALDFFFHPSTQVVLYAVLLFCILKAKTLPFGNDPAYSFFFIVLILNVSSNPRTILKLENPVFKYLGKISYGLYMYHMIAIMIALKFLLWALPSGSPSFDFLLYLLSLAAVIGIAACSYEFFERPFLSLKAKFSRILSGDLAEKKISV